MASATTSNFLYLAQLRQLLHGTSITADLPASGILWVALFKTLPGGYGDNTGAITSSPGVEVTRGVQTNYARVPINCNTTDGWTNPSGTSYEFSNLLDIIFPTPTSPSASGLDWGNIVGAGLFDQDGSVVNGRLYFLATLTTQKSVLAGDGAPKILANQLRILRATCG